jgi:hypothetical protein
VFHLSELNKFKPKTSFLLYFFSTVLSGAFKSRIIKNFFSPFLFFYFFTFPLLIMIRLLFTALLALACQTVFGHYQLTYPPSRGFDESREVIGPCGGFDSVSSNRTDFPLKNGFLEINSEHPKYTYKVNIAYGNNPTASDFSAVGQGQIQVSDPSHQSCLPVSLSFVKNATDGALATLQIIYMAGDGDLYQVSMIKP